MEPAESPILAATPEDCFRLESDHHWINRAIQLSKAALESGQFPIAAVLVDAQNRFIGEGFNMEQQTGTPIDHAEMVAIRDACQRFSRDQLIGATLYTTCEPCPMCLGAVYWSRIGRIVYGNSVNETAEFGFEDQTFFDEFKKPSYQRQVPIQQLNPFSAKCILEEWQEQVGEG